MRRIFGSINSRGSIFLLAVIVLTALAVQPCFSECEFDWKPGQNLPGIDGTVYAAANWDPDGNGPESELLIVAGSFSAAGDVLANNIAAWDGNDWQSLGSGLSGQVRVIEVYKGQLVAGGWFTTAGGVDANNIAAWDGNSWQSFDSGLSGGDSYPTVLSLTVYDGQLIAGGRFTKAGSEDVNYIATWDGNSWEGIGGGVFDSFSPHVSALAVYNGELVASGNFDTAGGVDVNNMAAWDGNSWQKFGNSNNRANAFAVYDGELIAGMGIIVTAWDGNSWHELGSGMNSGVCVFTIYNGELVAGGYFTEAGGVSANHVAAWDGSSWHAFGSGISGSSNIYVNALAAYNSELIGGGNFKTREGLHISKWDGDSWQKFGSGINDIVNSFTVYDGELIAGGDFTTAGGADANYIAAWDGNSWQSLGSGVDGDYYPRVYALTVYNGELIAGGTFTMADGVDANGIAAWDGNSWHKIGSGLSEVGCEGCSIRVYDLAVYNGELIAAGNFGPVGAYSDCNNIAAWDGNSWQVLGGGIKRGLGVKALTVYNGELIALGPFGTAGGLDFNSIAAWDGNSWHSLGGGLRSQKYGGYALTVYSGKLVAGGEIYTADDVDVNGIAAWDGNSWHPLGSGMSGGYPYDTSVIALTVYNGELIAGGYFTTAGGIDANYIAVWDDNSWYALGSGLNNATQALTVYNGELIAGGSFTKAGDYASGYWGRWGVPEIYEGDLNHDCRVGFYDLELFVERWLDEDCLYNGWCYEADLNYNGEVDLLDYAGLSANWRSGKVPGDIYTDWNVDFADYAILANYWMKGDCAEPVWCEGADFNKTGLVDMFDLSTLVEHWLEGD